MTKFIFENFGEKGGSASQCLSGGSKRTMWGVEIPRRLIITAKHMRLGSAAYDGYVKANGDDQGDRGLPYKGSSARHDAARMGLVVESSFLDAMGLDPRPRVNAKGRDSEVDCTIDAKPIDVKGTSKEFPYISRQKAKKCPDVLFVTYTFDGDLLAIATGADYIEHGERCTSDDLPYVPQLNMKLPVGFGT